MTTTFAGELLLQYANELVRSGKDLRSIIMGYSKANDLMSHIASGNIQVYVQSYTLELAFGSCTSGPYAVMASCENLVGRDDDEPMHVEDGDSDESSDELGLQFLVNAKKLMVEVLQNQKRMSHVKWRRVVEGGKQRNWEKT
ncbi:hypothetical protein F2Q70_00037613 [Brassica cretica]|uniref:Uncharacterized protein n=1 Tax=Brassica cretica TaxID=69181 RepID=A0A8S9JU80_BRACR|nr:hypothetical protein F2Q70_00037613 [Brassica cretica]